MTSGIPLGLALGSALFNVFVRDVNSEIGCSFSKFVDDTKLNELESRDGDLDNLENWAPGNLMRFNRAKSRSCS